MCVLVWLLPHQELTSNFLLEIRNVEADKQSNVLAEEGIAGGAKHSFPKAMISQVLQELLRKTKKLPSFAPILLEVQTPPHILLLLPLFLYSLSFYPLSAPNPPLPLSSSFSFALIST